MGTENVGECSSRQTDNTETERPLKKAKYVWQVKGKYHLKQKCQNNSEEKRRHHNNNNNNNNNNEGIGARADKESRYIDKFLEKTSTILDREEDKEDRKKSDFDRSILNEIPITLVSPNPENQDYYLRKWQARQIARGYIDNTINSVLETWVSAPAPFDAEDFVENCDDDGHIEDEGILMAIQAHGLQSNKSSKKGPSLSFVRPEELADNTLDKIDTVRPETNNNNDDDDDDDVPINSSSSSSDDRETENNAVYPVDILNAAILVAIEKKGLSSFNHHE